MKRKTRFAVGDVVGARCPSGQGSDVCEIEEDPNEVFVLSCATGVKDGTMCGRFGKRRILLASPFALAKKYCGYEEPE